MQVSGLVDDNSGLSSSDTSRDRDGMADYDNSYGDGLSIQNILPRETQKRKVLFLGDLLGGLLGGNQDTTDCNLECQQAGGDTTETQGNEEATNWWD